MRELSVFSWLFFCVWCASAELCAGNEPEPEIAKSPFDSTAAEQYQETWAKFLNRETEIENSLGMTFRLIPPGELTLGSPQDEPGRSTPREDQRDGRIDRPFYLGRHEVTQREYAAIMGTNPSNHQGKDYPVERITWNHAERFCRLLSERENVLYRLPTAAEWEFACRAGTTTPFSFGKTMDTDDANFDPEYTIPGFENRGGTRGTTIEVETFRPNAFGIHDMHGNVAEWCLDIDNWLQESPDNRQQAGGGYNSSILQCRSAAAEGLGRIRNANVGFRVVRELDVPQGAIDADYGKECADRLIARIKDASLKSKTRLKPRLLILPAVYGSPVDGSDEASTDKGATYMGSMWIAQSATLLAGYQNDRVLDVSLGASMPLYRKLRFYDQGIALPSKLLERCARSLGAEIYVIPRISGGAVNDYTMIVEIHGDQKDFPDKSIPLTIPQREPELLPRRLAETVCDYLKVPFAPPPLEKEADETLRNSPSLTRFELLYESAINPDRMQTAIQYRTSNDSTVDPDESLRRQALNSLESPLTWAAYLNFACNRPRALNDYQEHREEIGCQWLELYAARIMRQSGDYRQAFETLLHVLPSHIGESGFHREMAFLATSLDEPELFEYVMQWWSLEGKTPYDRKLMSELFFEQTTSANLDWTFSKDLEESREVRESLQQAKSLLEEAVEASPADPMFRADLIWLAGMLDLSSEYILEQFTAAIEADPGYADIYHHTFSVLRPHWKEAPDSALTFGLYCARSGLWRDKVPQLFESAVGDLYFNWETAEIDHEPFRKNPVIWEGIHAELDSVIDAHLPAMKRLNLDGIPHEWASKILSRGLLWGVYCGHARDLAIPLKVFEREAIYEDQVVICSGAQLQHIRDLIHAESAPGYRGKLAALRVALSKGDVEGSSSLLVEIAEMNPGESLQELNRCRKALDQLRQLKSTGSLEITPQMMLETWVLNDRGAWSVDTKQNVLVVRFPTRERTWMLCPFGFEEAQISGSLKMSDKFFGTQIIAHVASDMDPLQILLYRETKLIGLLRNMTWMEKEVWNDTSSDYSLAIKEASDQFEDSNGRKFEAKHKRLVTGSIAINIYPGNDKAKDSNEEPEFRVGPITIRLPPKQITTSDAGSIPDDF